jgi:hypothetical protein
MGTSTIYSSLFLSNTQHGISTRIPINVLKKKGLESDRSVFIVAARRDIIPQRDAGMERCTVVTVTAVWTAI